MNSSNKQKDNNGWVLCPSKRYPGKLYYFNVSTGEVAWTMNDIEKSEQSNKQNTLSFTIPSSNNIQNIVDKSHSYPEPMYPPLEDQVAVEPTRMFSQARYPNPIYTPAYPAPMFGQSVFPNYMHNMNPYNMPNYGMFMPNVSPYMPNYMWAPVAPSMMIPNHDIKVAPTSRPEIKSHQISMLVQTSSMPLSKRFTNLRADVNNNFASNEQNLTEQPRETTTLIKPTMFRFKPNVTEPSVQRTLSNTECTSPILNLSKSVLNQSIKPGGNLNGINAKKTFIKQNESSNKLPAMLQSVETLCISEPEDANSTLNPNKGVEISKTNNIQQKQNLPDTQNDSMILDESDLRLTLMAKKRKADDSSDQISNKDCVKPKKRVTFSLDVANEDDLNEADRDVEDDLQPPTSSHSPITIDTLRELGDVYERDAWYIVVDVDILLSDHDFIEAFVQKDAGCRLYVPYAVQSEIDALSLGDSRGRQRVVAARHLSRWLATPRPHVILQTKLKESDLSTNDATLECCLQLTEDFYHVVLITNDDALYNKAIKFIYCYKLEEIKNDETTKKPELCFQFKRARTVFSDKSDEKNKGMPDNNDKLINITKLMMPSNNVTTIDQNKKVSSIDKKTLADAEYSHKENKQNISNTERAETRKRITFDIQKASADSGKEEQIPGILTFQKENTAAFPNSMDDFLKRFCVDSEIIENRIRSRAAEWMCCFTQILEDALTEVLLHQPLSLTIVPPPWSVHDCVEAVAAVNRDSKIHNAAAKLHCMLLRYSNKKEDILKNIVQPEEFVKMIACSIYLLELLKNVPPSSEILGVAEESLRCLLERMENPEADTVLPDKPDSKASAAGADIEDIPKVKSNFKKTRSDVVEYLKKHFPAWASYDTRQDAQLQPKPVAQPAETVNVSNVIRTSGRNLNILRIDSKKSMSFEQTLNEISELKYLLSKKADSQTSTNTTDAFGGRDNINDYLELRKIDRTSELLHKNDTQMKKIDCEKNVPINIDVVTSTDRHTFDRGDKGNDQPKVVRNIKLIDAYEEKLRSSHQNKQTEMYEGVTQDTNAHNSNDPSNKSAACDDCIENNDTWSKTNDDQSTINIEQYDLINDMRSKSNDACSKTNDTYSKTNDVSSKTNDVSSKTNDVSSKTNDIYSKTNDAYLKTDDVSSKTNDVSSKTNDVSSKTNAVSSKTNENRSINNDTYNCTNSLDTFEDNSTPMKEDSFDSEFGSGSLQAYTLLNSFLTNLSRVFITTYNFIETSMDKLQDEIDDSGMNELFDRANKIHFQIVEIINNLKCIIKRESGETSALKTMLLRAGVYASDDKRVTRYSQVVTKCLEQAQILENALSMMRCFATKDYHMSMLIADSAGSNQYFNIFE